jgi:AcrR family transcriptional regulator
VVTRYAIAPAVRLPQTAKKSPRKRLSAAERRELIERAAMEVFTERGYHGAAIDEIARRAGITPPVLYDHFPSKLALHRRLLERTRDELLEMWRDSLAGEEPAAIRVPRSIDAWARYVETHPYAAKVFFMDTTGDPEARAIHREVAGQGLSALSSIMATETLPGSLPSDQTPLLLEMASEVMRSGLTGLAIWWTDHPEVTREQIVFIAVNSLWVGLERALAGELWTGPPPATGRLR